MLTLAALTWTSCTEDNEKPALPTITVGEPVLNADNTKAVVTITPSSETENWYWKCVEKGGTTGKFTTVTGKEESNLEIPISMDLDYTLTAYAENESGKSQEVSKEFIFRYADIMNELVEFEIKNVSAFSMDVIIKKSAKCAKYVVGAVLKGYDSPEGFVTIYKDETFIEDAEKSFNPDPNYPLQPFNYSEVSTTFTEQILVRDAMQDKDINASKGIRLTAGDEYIIAVYAIDAEGNTKLYQKAVHIPAADLTGDVAVEINIPKDKIGIRSFEATFTADAQCSRMIVGQTLATIIGKNHSSAGKDFDKMTEEEIHASIATLGADIPTMYTQPFTKEFTSKDMQPGVEYIVYAIPIDTNGKIGKIKYVKVTTARPVFDGVGQITSVSFPEQTDVEKLSIDISVSNDVESVRVLWLPGTGPGASDIEWIMADEASKGVQWEEYTREGLATLKTVDGGVYISNPGETYYLRAVTVDKNGKLSPIIDLVEKAGLGSNGIKTKEKEVEKPAGPDFTGNGELTLEVLSEGTNPDGYSFFAELKISKGSNTAMVYKVKWSEAVPDGVEEYIKELPFFKNFTPDSKPAGVVSIALDENTQTQTIVENFYTEYDAHWGGESCIFVTLDKDGKLSIADYYIYGYGVKK